MEKDRIEWIDLSKGIAIIAVALSHEFASVNELVIITNSFMLPLFFFVSGYCLKPRKYKISKYISNKIQSLLIPYFILGLIVSILQIPINGIATISYKVLTELFSWQTLWFLPVLFIADLITYIYLSFCKNKLFETLILYFISLLSAIIIAKLNLNLPISLSALFIAIFYLTTGTIVKQYLTLPMVNQKKEKIFGLGLFFIGIFINLYYNIHLDLKLNKIMPIAIISSILECIGIMLFIKNIHWHIIQKALTFIGRNTMAIFAFHMPIFFYCQSYLRPLINNSFFI